MRKSEGCTQAYLRAYIVTNRNQGWQSSLASIHSNEGYMCAILLASLMLRTKREGVAQSFILASSHHA